MLDDLDLGVLSSCHFEQVRSAVVGERPRINQRCIDFEQRPEDLLANGVGQSRPARCDLRRRPPLCHLARASSGLRRRQSKGRTHAETPCRCRPRQVDKASAGGGRLQAKGVLPATSCFKPSEDSSARRRIDALRGVDLQDQPLRFDVGVRNATCGGRSSDRAVVLPAPFGPARSRARGAVACGRTPLGPGLLIWRGLSVRTPLDRLALPGGKNRRAAPQPAGRQPPGHGRRAPLSASTWRDRRAPA